MIQTTLLDKTIFVLICSWICLKKRSWLSPGLKVSPWYKSVDLVNHKIHKESYLHLRLHLQQLKIGFQVKAIKEIVIEVFGKKVEVIVK